MSAIQKYAGSRLFERLVTWVGMVRKALNDNEKNADLLHDIDSKFNDIVRQETNINGHININDKVNISVRIPDLSKNGALFGPWFAAYMTNGAAYSLFDKNKNSTVGWTDILTGKVHGCFTKPAVPILINTFYIKRDRFMPEELAAAICHELGHYFTYCTYLTSMYTTNRVLQRLNDQLTYEKDTGKRVTIIAKSFRDVNPNTKADADKIASIEDNDAIGVCLLAEAVEVAKSEFGLNVYDWTSWEQMSDEYATNQGGGVWNARALDKLYDGSFNIDRRPYLAYLLMESAKAFATVIFPPLGIYMIACDKNDPRYDRPKDRMNRIRNTLLSAIDSKKEYTSEEITKLKESVETIEELMDNYSNREQFYYPIVWLFSSSERKERRDTNTQKDIEDLAAHTLRLRLAEFNTVNKIKGM